MASVAEIIRRQIDEGLAGDPLAALLRLGRLEETSLAPPRQGPGRLPRGPGDRSGLARRRGRAGAVAGRRRGQDAAASEQEEGDKGDKADKKAKKGKPAPTDPAVLDVVARLIPYYELTENYKKWAGALETLSGRAGPEERLGHLHNLVDLYGGPLEDNVSAFLTAIKIFELEPHDSGIRERLVGMATEVDGTKDLLDSVRRVLEAGGRARLPPRVAGLPGGDRREAPRRRQGRRARLPGDPHPGSAVLRGLPRADPAVPGRRALGGPAQAAGGTPGEPARSRRSA